MTYELEINRKGDHLYAKVTGNRTIETVMSMAMDILSSCIEHKCDRVLIDIQEMIGKLDPLDTYQYSNEYLPGLKFGGKIKVAVLDLEENRNRFELVMRNARIKGIDMRIVPELDEATRWLSKRI